MNIDDAKPGNVKDVSSYAGYLWAYDFVHDACANGPQFECLTIIDEFTRECLAIDVERPSTTIGNQY